MNTDKNEFVAFKALFDKELHLAISKENKDQINVLLKTKYKEEKNFYKDVPLNLETIQGLFDDHVKDIDDNPNLIYKL